MVAYGDKAGLLSTSRRFINDYLKCLDEAEEPGLISVTKRMKTGWFSLRQA